MTKSEKYLKKLEQKWGNRYNLLEVNYQDSKTFITPICYTHGKFEKNPSEFLRGYGCKLCADDAKKLSWPDLMKEFDELYDGQFDYLLSKYVNMKTNIDVRCKKHDVVFQITPANHKKHGGCPSCRKEGYGQHLKSNLFNFKENAYPIHGDAYSYPDDESAYKGYNYPIEITCKIHGNFNQLVKNHLAGAGCPLCSNKKLGQHNLLTNEQKTALLDKCNTTHKGFYKYPLPDFSRVYDKIPIDCPIHGIFDQRVLHHKKGQGCPKCGQERIAFKLKLPSEEFIRRGKVMNGDKCDYSRVHDFKNIKEQVLLGCNVCHKDFKQLVEVHLRGHGCPNCVTRESKWEMEIMQFLKDSGVTDLEKTRSVIGKFELDMYSKLHNIALEANGNYYHSELGGNKRPMYHLHKTQLCQKVGIDLVHVFEDEWYYKKEIVKSVLLSKFGLIKDKIYARKCVIKEISAKDKSRFLEDNHLFGSAGSTVKLGLYHDDELVSCMSFIKHPDYEWNLNRFSNKINLNVIGGASKLLNYFTETYKPKTIMSLADLRWGTGKLYNTLGFVAKNKTVRPTYYYTKNYIDREHKQNYRRSKLAKKLLNFDPNKSEKDNMFAHGYDRIWDCGHITYIKTII